LLVFSALTLSMSMPAFAQPSDAPDEERQARRSALEARLTPEQKKSVEAFRQRFATDITPVRSTSLSDRWSAAAAPNRTVQVVVVRRNPDGTMATGCVRTPDEYVDFLLADAGEAAITAPAPVE
jgi:hypothetical protein